MKRCYRCGECKPPASFYRNARKRDGLQSACKPCWDAYLRERKQHLVNLQVQAQRELDADWRTLEARRLLTAQFGQVRRVDWECRHGQGDREKTYNGLGLKTPVRLGGG